MCTRHYNSSYSTGRASDEEVQRTVGAQSRRSNPGTFLVRRIGIAQAKRRAGGGRGGERKEGSAECQAEARALQTPRGEKGSGRI